MSGQGNLKEVKRLLFADRNRLELLDPKGFNSIHHASMNNQPKIIQFFADEDAGKNFVDYEEL